MLVSDVLTRVRDILNDESGSRWSDTRIIRDLNAAQLAFCRETKILRDSLNIVVHSKQSNYEIPNCHMQTRALYNNKPLAIISLAELDKLKGNWETDTGVPTHLVFDKLNRGVIRLYPIPDFEVDPVFNLNTANKLNVNYIRYPDKLLAVDDELELPDLYLETLVFYITGNILRADMDTQNRQVGNEQLMLYKEVVNELKLDQTLDFTHNPDAYTIKYRGAYDS